MKTKIDPALLQNPVFKALMAEGLAIQERFSAEPVYARRTGQGYLKSEGVEELQKAKASQLPRKKRK